MHRNKNKGKKSPKQKPKHNRGKKLEQTEYTWKVDPETKEIIIKVPTNSEGKRLSQQYRNITFEVGGIISAEPWTDSEDEKADVTIDQIVQDHIDGIDYDEETDSEEEEVIIDVDVDADSSDDDEAYEDYIKNISLNDDEEDSEEDFKPQFHENVDVDDFPSTEPTLYEEEEVEKPQKQSQKLDLGFKTKSPKQTTEKANSYEIKTKAFFSVRDLHELNSQFRKLVEADTVGSCLGFSRLSKLQRAQIAQLARGYYLKMECVGSGKRSFLQIFKTQKSIMLPMERATELISDIFNKGKSERKSERAEGRSPSNKSQKTPRSNGKNPNNKDKYGHYKAKNKSKKRNDDDETVYSTVNERTTPLDDSNVGMKMLKGMGWREGVGLGKDGSGITTPIDAVIKQDKRGLGFFTMKSSQSL